MNDAHYQTITFDYGRWQVLAVLLEAHRRITFPAISREEATQHSIAAFVLIRAVRHIMGFHCRESGRSSIPEMGLAL